MSRARLNNERAESALEFAGILALTVAVLATIAWVLIAKPGQAQTPNLTPEQQAYVVAVATQQADAYIRAVATQQAAAPVAPAPPRATVAPPPAAPPPTPIPASDPPLAPNPTISPPPPAPPPPPPESAKPPMATCVGFMVGVTETGIEACQSIISGTTYDLRVRTCIYDIVSGNGTTATGKANCVQAALAAGDAKLSDCFLGLVGESHFGRQSCYMYYRSQ